MLRSEATLRHGHEFRRAAEGVERENAVFLGKAEIRSDLRRERGARCLFLGELRADDGRLRWLIQIRAGFVVLLPLLGRGHIDKRERNVFLLAVTLCAAVVDNIADDLVAVDELISSIFEYEACARGLIRTLRRAGNVHGTVLLRLLTERRRGAEEQNAEQGQAHRPQPLTTSTQWFGAADHFHPPAQRVWLHSTKLAESCVLRI